MLRPLVLLAWLVSAFTPVLAQEGAASKPLVFIFQKQKEPTALQASADRIGNLLAKALAQPVKVVIPLDYSASVQALISGQADVAYISALPFLLARRDGGAKLLLVEERTDARGMARTEYDSILVVKKESSLKDFSDLSAQARTLSMVFTAPTSTSGYVFPLRRLVDSGLLKQGADPRTLFKQVQFGGSYTQALNEVLAGRGDVAAVSDYTMEGPAADVYLPAEARARLRILARTPGVPTHLIATRKGLPDATREAVKKALLGLSESDPTLLRDVYGATRFLVVDENQHVAAAVRALERSGVPIEGLAK